MSKSAKPTALNRETQIGVLLINLGTPRSPNPRDVKRYLNEFLTDKYVIDLPWLFRQCLVRGIIVPRRYRASAELYRSIWTTQGSPLLTYGHALENALQQSLGDRFCVRLAMRYQKPSLQEALRFLATRALSSLVVLPLFPQFSTATTGSIEDALFKHARAYPHLPKMTMIKNYPTHPGFINALCAQAARLPLNAFDRILISYHGLPERQLKKVDPSGLCLNSSQCCQTLSQANRYCYAAQCHATTRALVGALGLTPHQYRHCYQSRLGRAAWLRPYTSDIIIEEAQRGAKKLAVFCPSFVADCLETLSEIRCEYRALFLKHGGEELDLIEAPNTHPLWVAALKKMTLESVVQKNHP